MFELIKENIKKAEVTDDCCGKWDLDFPVLYISTRGWPDNTAKCSFMLASDDESAGDWEDILESDYIQGDSREDCIQKCRKWYIDNLHVVMNSFVAEAESVNEDKVRAFDEMKEIFKSIKNSSESSCVLPNGKEITCDMGYVMDFFQEVFNEREYGFLKEILE